MLYSFVVNFDNLYKNTQDLTDITEQKRLERALAVVCRFKVRNADLLQTKCQNCLTKDCWTPNSLGLKLLVGGYRNCHPKPKMIIDLQNTADDLGQPASEVN